MLGKNYGQNTIIRSFGGQERSEREGTCWDEFVAKNRVSFMYNTRITLIQGNVCYIRMSQKSGTFVIFHEFWTREFFALKMTWVI
jgi:hypothetical protein